MKKLNKSREYRELIQTAKQISIQNDIYYNSELDWNKRLPLFNGYSRNELEQLITKISGRNRSGNCQDISMNLLNFLGSKQIEAEIVIGDIKHNGEQIYGTDINHMLYEFHNEIRKGIQKIHCWISVGADTIIDGAFYHYSVEVLGWEREWQSSTIISTAQELYDNNQIEYLPMLVGCDFLLQTNNYHFPPPRG